MLLFKLLERVRKPSVRVMLTLFRRVILILFCGIVTIGSSLLLPNVLHGRLLSQSIVMNSTSIVNASLQNMTSPMYSDVGSVGLIKNRTDDCLLILRQNQTNQRNVFYIEIGFTLSFRIPFVVLVDTKCI